MSDRPTPETDALDCELHNPRVMQDSYSEMRDHAQQLERERDEAREQIKELIYITESAISLAGIYFENDKVSELRNELRFIKVCTK